MMAFEKITQDKQVLHLMNLFRSIKDKQIIADVLAKQCTDIALKTNNTVFERYYADISPFFVTASCISFGIKTLMIEDFYVVKEVLGYDNVLNVLKTAESYVKLVK